MSDAGMLSGIFGQLSEYSLALNRLLIEAKAKGLGTTFDPPVVVRELIERLSESFHPELGIQALANGLESESVEFNRAGVSRLRQAVHSARTYQQIVHDLEGLAKLVSSQQTGAYFRLRHPV